MSSLTAVVPVERLPSWEATVLQWQGPAHTEDLLFPAGYTPGRSGSMRKLYAQMRSLLLADIPVLLLGETGVGKEQLARTLHASGPRREGPFLAVNCAAIPADLLEAEMFGIGKGVATGVNERRGRFVQAEGGTLFLDEIGDMSPALQAKLLRALEGREVQPVGGAPVPIDVRVIAATNSDVDRRMQEGQFRRDLYYRVAGIVLRVPALRERPDDILDLVEGFLAAAAADCGAPAPRLSAEARRALLDHPWPGNVRELEHEAGRLACLCADGQDVEVWMLSEHIRERGEDATAAPCSLDLETNVEHLERRLIRAALARTGGRRAAAARLLGISRNGLALKMDRLDLAVGTRGDARADS